MEAASPETRKFAVAPREYSYPLSCLKDSEKLYTSINAWVEGASVEQPNHALGGGENRRFDLHRRGLRPSGTRSAQLAAVLAIKSMIFQIIAVNSDAPAYLQPSSQSFSRKNLDQVEGT
jgi:hypothetical protein